MTEAYKHQVPIFKAKFQKNNNKLNTYIAEFPFLLNISRNEIVSPDTILLFLLLSYSSRWANILNYVHSTKPNKNSRNLSYMQKKYPQSSILKNSNKTYASFCPEMKLPNKASNYSHLKFNVFCPYSLSKQRFSSHN